MYTGMRGVLGSHMCRQTPQLVTGRLRNNSRSKCGSRSGLEFVMVESQENLGRKDRYVGGRAPTLRQSEKLETS